MELSVMASVVESVSSRPTGKPDGLSVCCRNLTKVVESRSLVDRVIGCSAPSERKKILDGVNLCVNPGQILGVIGPSGGGKTTLLNIIAQRSLFGKTTGEVLFNGRHQTKDQVKMFTNYVMAHDKLHAYLTVEETLQIAAKLKLPKMSKKERMLRIEQVIRDMGLHRCRNTYIGGEWKKGVSSGEMKRVSIAIELLDDPQLLLLDEPTSGLDSSLALEVMQVLVALARAGRTIIMTIHQPRSQVFSMIDIVALLNKGRVVYAGPPDNVRTHFGALGYPCPSDWNPADFVLDLISDREPDGELVTPERDRDVDSDESEKICHEEFRLTVLSANHLTLPTHEVDALADKWQNTETQRHINNTIEGLVANPGPEPTPHHFAFVTDDTWKTWPAQFSALYRRFTLNSVRNPVVCCLMILIQAIQGLVLGGIFFQLSSGVDHIPTPSSPDWLQTTWAQVLMYGVDGGGTRPLVDLVENGVDGYGSRPLLDLFSNPENMEFFHNVLQCTHEAYGLNETPPTYPPNDFPPPSNPATLPARMVPEFVDMRASVVRLIKDLKEGRLPIPNRPTRMLEAKIPQSHFLADEGFRRLEASIMGITPVSLDDDSVINYSSTAPYRVISDLVSLLQLVDWFMFRADYARAEMCLDKRDDAAMFYLCAVTHIDYLLNPLLGCLGLPHLPGFDQPNPTKVSTTRKLSSAIMRGLARKDVESMMSDQMMQMVEAVQEIVERISSCDNDICRAVATSLEFTSDIVDDSITTILVVLNLAGCIYFAVANLGFASYDALLTFPQERAVFNHETSNGLYCVSSYFLAKNFADLPFQLGPALTLSTVYYLMVGLSPTVQQFFTYFFICAFTSFAAYGFGYMVSAASPRMEISVLVAPFILMVWLVLAGFFLRDNDIPVWIDWFKYLSLYRWGFFALICNEFPPGTYFGTFPSELILTISGITDTRVWFTALMPLVLGVGFRLLCFFFLKFTNRSVGIER